MTINVWAVVVATIAQFIIGAVWYSALFGKVWGQIHGFDKLSKEAQKEMMGKMGPFYGLQFLVTILTSVVLAKLMLLIPDYSPYMLAGMVWLGFIVPTQYADVIFGGTESKWIIKKLLIIAAASLLCLLAAAGILQAF